MPSWCPNCEASSYSYPSPNDSMPEIPCTCKKCGTTWYEPNEQYIEAECRNRRDEYYDRFSY
jgi:hypothetical protein